jgi:hypothetical protein
MPATVAATIEPYETASGWMFHRRQKRTAPLAVCRNRSAIGLRELGLYSDMIPMR